MPKTIDGKEYLTEQELFEENNLLVVGRYAGDTLVLEQAMDQLTISVPEFDVEENWSELPDDPDGPEGTKLFPKNAEIEMREILFTATWDDHSKLLTLDSHTEEPYISIEGVKELAYWLMQTAKRKENLQQEQKSDTD